MPQKFSHPDPERQAADLWGRILEEARQLLPPKTFDEWVRPLRPVELRDDRLRLRVPTLHHRQVLENRLAESLRQAADRAGLEDLRFEFVVPDGGPAAEAPGGLVALRDFIARHPIVAPGSVERLARRIRRAGCDVDDWADEVRLALERLVARTSGAWPEALRELRADPEALLRDLARTRIERPAPPEERYGLDHACGLTSLYSAPALLLSRKRQVTVRLRLHDGTVVEMRRLSAVGLGPRAAALFDYLVSLVRTLPEERFSHDPGWDVWHFDVPIGVVKELLGIEGKLHTREFRVIHAAITAQFAGQVFTPDGEAAGRAFSVFEVVRRTRGRRAVLRVGVRGYFFRRLRGERPPLRSFSPEALGVLAGVDAVTAALARWLAVRFHGDAHVRKPLRIDERELYALTVGGNSGRVSGEVLRWFRRRVRAAVRVINERGLLRLLGVPEPCGVTVRRDGGAYVFRRVATLPSGKRVNDAREKGE